MNFKLLFVAFISFNAGMVIPKGVHNFLQSRTVENRHISQQPKERHYRTIEAPVIVCDTIKAKVHLIINER
jgi:hypothetical protein